MSRLLIGRGITDVWRDVQRGEYIELPGYQMRVAGHIWHSNARDGQVLAQMRAEDPKRAPVAVRLMDPEMEQGLVIMFVDDWIDLLLRTQEHIARS